MLEIHQHRTEPISEVERYQYWTDANSDITVHL